MSDSVGRYFAVYIVPDLGKTDEDMEKAFNKCLDWFRASRNFWVIYSPASVPKLYERFFGLVKDQGNLFIAAIKEDETQGWMSKDFWEWLQKSR